MNQPQPIDNVELVGGPQCGLTVKWKTNKPIRYVEFEGNNYPYRYEGAGKAVYVLPEERQDKVYT